MRVPLRSMGWDLGVSLLSERCAVVVMAIAIVPQHLAKVRHADDDGVVEAFAPDRSDKAFGMTVLPGRMRPNRLVTDAHRPQTPAEDLAVSAVVVAQQDDARIVPRRKPRLLTQKSDIAARYAPNYRPCVGAWFALSDSCTSPISPNRTPRLRVRATWRRSWPYLSASATTEFTSPPSSICRNDRRFRASSS